MHSPWQPRTWPKQTKLRFGLSRVIPSLPMWSSRANLVLVAEVLLDLRALSPVMHVGQPQQSPLASQPYELPPLEFPSTRVVCAIPLFAVPMVLVSLLVCPRMAFEIETLILLQAHQQRAICSFSRQEQATEKRIGVAGSSQA